MDLRVAPTSETHRATTFELFFDLVYVFAITQVSGFVAHEHSADGVLRGLLMVALLWWTWSAYTWLGNQARADVGAVRLGMTLAMSAIFVVALAIPHAWEHESGSLDGPVVLVVAYLVVRLIHMGVYAVAAAGDRDLLRQLAITVSPMLAGSVLLFIGAFVGGTTQVVLFASALAVDWTGTYLTARHGGWRLYSVAHWTERHGLFVIIVIGESVVAIGVGASSLPISGPLLLAAILGVGVATCLWWLYFDVVAEAAERRLNEYTGADRVEVGRDAFTYGHFPIVAGIVLVAVGLEGVIAHADSDHHLGTLGAATLFGGLALYLLGHVAFEARLHGTLCRARAVGALVMVGLTVPAAAAAPLVALVLGLVALVALIVWEGARGVVPGRGLSRA